MIRKTIVWTLLALATAWQCASAQTVGVASVLRPGDRVRVTVFRNQEMSGEFPVLSDGTLGHPAYKGVHVAGLPMRSVEAAIQEVVSKLFDAPAIVVEPLYKVVITGEVRAPSIYAVPPTTTIIEALATAGGIPATGDPQKVIIIRGGAASIIDLTDPTLEAAGNQPIKSGDQITVARKRSLFRDVIAPAASVTSALVGILSFIILQSK